jgi:hypothetical protein
MHLKALRMHPKAFRMHTETLRMHPETFRMHLRRCNMHPKAFRMHARSFPRRLERPLTLPNCPACSSLFFAIHQPCLGFFF